MIKELIKSNLIDSKHFNLLNLCTEMMKILKIKHWNVKKSLCITMTTCKK